MRNEILIRLLHTPLRSRVVQTGQVGSHVQPIASTVWQLRATFDATESMDGLAKLLNMSVTSFHRQFKGVTGMSLP